MTRRTQKSSRQRKRQYTRRRGGMDRHARRKCIKGFIETLINGIRQCRRKPVEINNGYENNEGSEYRKLKQPQPPKINTNKNKNKKNK